MMAGPNMEDESYEVSGSNNQDIVENHIDESF